MLVSQRGASSPTLLWLVLSINAAPGDGLLRPLLVGMFATYFGQAYFLLLVVVLVVGPTFRGSTRDFTCGIYPCLMAHDRTQKSSLLPAFFVFAGGNSSVYACMREGAPDRNQSDGRWWW